MYALGRLRFESKRLHLELTIFKALFSTYFKKIYIGLFSIPARPDTIGWWPLSLNCQEVDSLAS